MAHLKIIKNNVSHEDRIQIRINNFAKEIQESGGEIQYVEAILVACIDYMHEYEDDDIYQASVKIREGIYYLGNFLQY